MSDALTCVDCAETDGLFHMVARQRDEARAELKTLRNDTVRVVTQHCAERDEALAALDRVRALCDSAHQSAAVGGWVGVSDLRAAVDGPGE